MTKIYVGQVLEVTLDTEIDISAAVSPVIRAITPSGVVKLWPATVNDTTLIYTTTKDVDLVEPGTWRLQAVPHVLDLEAPGETVLMRVYALGR